MTPTGDHHSPTFNPDETVLWRGVLFWLAIVCVADTEAEGLTDVLENFDDDDGFYRY